jgi:hypothetical protein
VTLYFADTEGKSLAPDLGRIAITDSTVENCRNALDALLKGPRDGLTPILPPPAAIRGVYLLEDGELVVDCSMDLETELKRIRSASLESLLVYGVVNTLTQPAVQGAKDVRVTKVRFLIEGSSPRETFPSHLDMSNPIAPDPGWIGARQE